MEATNLRFKTIMILTLILVFLVGVSAVNAAENLTDNLVSIGDTNDEFIIINDDQSSLKATNSIGNYTELQELIQNGSDGDILELSKDYKFDSVPSKTGISIKHAITINGNNYEIDADYNSRIFLIESNNVVLKNIKLINGHGSRINNNPAIDHLFGSPGGSVYSDYDNITLINCSIIDNLANSAAYITGKNAKIINCTFSKNRAYDSGGAITLRGDNSSITGSKFINNNAYTTIEIEGSCCKIDNCTLINNRCVSVYFKSNGTLINCNFANNYAYGMSTVCFYNNGNVTNCNFTDNMVDDNICGGAIWMSSGSVENCNFVNNTATNDGGAIYFVSNGNVTNCNFTNNKATNGGAVYFTSDGTVSNCNFTNNKATCDNSSGGAVFFHSKNSIVVNCIFVDNFAISGKSIFCNESGAVTADTCIFNSMDSNIIFNTVIFPPTLNVDNFKTFYGSGEKLTFDLKTNSGIPVTNGNILISTYFKDNNSWIGNYSCLSSEGWTVDLPVGSYYSIFDTEYTEFKPINRTIKIIPNTKYYANVTSLTTNNKTVNITAKSNIPQEILEGKLIFILQNGTEISANYNTNGIWWALHTFDNYGDYNINASYIGLDNVTINNATITINKPHSIITFEDVVMNYGDSINVTITTEGAIGITAKINYDSVSVVNNYIIPISYLDAGNYTLTVTTIPDEDHNSTTNTFNITVNKVDSTLTVEDIILDYNSNGSTAVSYTGATGVNATIIDQPKAVVNVGENKITVSGLDAGKYNLTVTTIPDKNHKSVNKIATVTVSKQNISAEIIIPANINVSENSTVNLKLPKDATGTVTLAIDGKNHIYNVVNGTVNIIIPDLCKGNYNYTIIYSGDSRYSSFTNDGSLNVVVPTIKVSNTKITYKSGSYYIITVYDVYDKLANDAKIVITINNKPFKNLTTKNGVAKFKVNNVPGIYKLNITSLGKTVTKILTVKHLVTLKKVTVKRSAKKLVLTANLGKINKKYLKNKKIIFKFNGKKYTAKTNKKGVAKVTIKSSVLKKLKVGKKITYQATYLKDTVKKTTKVKK